MITDHNLRVSDAQAITDTAVSVNSIDLSTPRDIGEGENLYMHFAVPTALTGGTSLKLEVIAADDAALSSGVVSLGSTDAVPISALGAGYSTAVRINPQLGSTGKRYLGARYTAVGTFTAGTVTADIVHDIQDGRKNYPSGLNVV